MPLVKKPNSAAFCHFPMDSNAFPSYLRRTDLEIIEWNEIDSKSIPAVGGGMAEEAIQCV